MTYTEQHVSRVLGLSVEQLWRTQPYLRTIVTFLARNIAQLGVHSFERVTETDRRRLRDDPLVKLLKRPNPQMTTYELIFSLVADLALYDEAIWIIGQDAESDSGWTIYPLAPSWVTRKGGGSIFAPEWIEFVAPGRTFPTRVDVNDLLWFHGWNPGEPSTASSPVESLKQILAEQIYAQVYRQQIWQRGGRVGTVLTRPAGAKWDPKTREKFQRQWQAKYAGMDGAMAGGTPILEDGMELKRLGFSSHEDEFVESAKLSLSIVASVYHVNPTMIGVLDNANFSNVREFRKGLYGDTLGPTISMIEDRLNTFLVPRVAAVDGVYVEFNISEKLQGNFEEQSAAMSSAVGRPWMTADEARSKQNMPSLGGDAEQLVTPLNVLVGGQASPRDSAKSTRFTPAQKAQRTLVKERASEAHETQAEAVLRKFFKRQRAVVLSELGSKASTDWWDAARWDRELSDDLFKLAAATATSVGIAAAEALGFTEGDYDEARTLKFLKAVSASRAGAINSTTQDQITESLASDEEDRGPADVFDEAEGSRAAAAALTLVTTFSAFATTEAAKQVAGDSAKKTWIVNSGNPRAEHAAMDGETVGINETFSNGADWPGDPALGAEGVANCACGVEVSI
ncbi:phage portal protein [Cryobacterium zongtaii]|uniref:Phage portal protein n=1 Tax=Cryobacterium zongtaii TaxID=1259217 RepID=A0A2S3ZCI1_9MICO|nr:phage portal protein [Cryobacterium zongtaii]